MAARIGPPAEFGPTGPHALMPGQRVAAHRPRKGPAARDTTRRRVRNPRDTPEEGYC